MYPILYPDCRYLRNLQVYGLSLYIGHETTSHTLSWFIYSLACHPDIQEKCANEVDRQHRNLQQQQQLDPREESKESLAFSETTAATPASTPAATAAGIATSSRTRASTSASSGHTGPSHSDTSSSATQPATPGTTSAAVELPAYVEAVLKESMRRFPVADRGSLRLVRKGEKFRIPRKYIAATAEPAQAADTRAWCNVPQSQDAQQNIANEVQQQLSSLSEQQQQPQQQPQPSREEEHARDTCTGHDQEDIVVPPGSWLLVNFYALHNGTYNWGPDALQFNPERWLPVPSTATTEIEGGMHMHTEPEDINVTPISAHTTLRSRKRVVTTNISTAGALIASTERTATRSSTSIRGASSGSATPSITAQPTCTSTSDPCDTDIGGGDDNADNLVNGGANPLSSRGIYAGGGLDSTELRFAPFSFGLRNCIGMHLALQEIRLTIFELVRQFHFRLADDTMEDTNAAMCASAITLQPKDQLPVIVERRTTRLDI